MKRKILALVLVFAFMLSQTVIVDAKGFRSSGGRSFSKSFSSAKSSSGYSGSSKSSKGVVSSGTKSSSGASSSSGYSGSSARSVPGSYSSSSSKSTTKSSAAATSKKSAYMQDAYKKQTSSANYGTYKQKLNAEQQKVYDSSMNNSNFKVNNRMNFENSINSRSQRINNMGSRPVYVNVRPGLFSGPMTWGMGYVGMWDMWFLMSASQLFWYHHWAEIGPYRENFDEKKFAEMEARVKELEKQNIAKDPNYMEPGVDADLQLSKEYQEKNIDKVYYTDKYSQPESNPAGTVVVIIIIGAVLLIVFMKAAKPKPKKTYNSRIY